MDDSTRHDGGQSGELQAVKGAFYRTKPPGNFPFYDEHPLEGDKRGDFHLKRRWTEAEAATVVVGRGTGPSLALEVWEFVVTEEYDTSATDLRGRPMFAYPRAVVKTDAVLLALIKFTKQSESSFLASGQNSVSDIERRMFEEAAHHKDLLVQEVIHFCTASQFMRSGWQCELSKMDEQSIAGLPAWVREDERPQIPGYVDYQLASIIVPYLSSLLKEILQKLEEKFLNLEYDSVLELAVFMLLGCAEGEIKFQAEFAARRASPLRYMCMRRIKVVDDGADTLLRGYHRCHHYGSLLLEATLISSIKPPDSFDELGSYTRKMFYSASDYTPYQIPDISPPAKREGVVDEPVRCPADLIDDSEISASGPTKLVDPLVSQSCAPW